MAYQKISAIVRQSANDDRGLVLSPEQIAKLNTAAGVALAVIAVAGVVSMAALAPNLLAALGSLHKQAKGGKQSAKDKTRETARAVYYLKRNGYINMEPDKKGWLISLTDSGKKKIQNLNIESLVVPRPKGWDGHWWQVASDIPTEQYKQRADALRKKLKVMGFYGLQKSLWFYPYDPRKEVEFASQFYGIAHFVTLMEVSRMDCDDEKLLRKYFKSLKII